MKAKPEKTEDPSLQLALAAADLADDVKAVGITILDLREVSSVADYFVIASGRSHIQVEAICDRIAEGVRERLERRPIAVEGLEQAMWGILDYGSVVVHVFQESVRELYDLERLWNLAPRWKHGEKPPKSVTGGAEAAKTPAAKPAAGKKAAAKDATAKPATKKSAATKSASSASKKTAAASPRRKAASDKPSAPAAKPAAGKTAAAKSSAKSPAKSSARSSTKSSAKPAAKAPAKKAAASAKKPSRKPAHKTASPEA